MSRRVTVNLPDPSVAIDAKYDLQEIAEDRDVTPQEYEEALNVFKYNLPSDEFQKLKDELDVALNNNGEVNKKISKVYYSEQILIIIILNVFTSILPGLIKENIPENIVSFVIFALRMYNFQLLNYYYNFFVDPKNPGIEDVKSKGKTVSMNNYIMINNYALTNSIQAKNFVNGHYIIINGLISIKSDLETFMKDKQIFEKDQKNRLRFIFLYLVIFIVMLYIAHFKIDDLKSMLINFIAQIKFDKIDELKSMLNKKELPPLINQTPRITILPSGGKKSKSNKSIKPKKPVAITKKASPKKASPKKASPKKASPKKASPKKASPKKASPKKASPKKASPKKASPKKASPKI